VTVRAFPYLLLPTFWSARNRARRREAGDATRAGVMGGIALVVGGSIFAIVWWLTWQLLGYEELGDYLVRLGLSWLFLTFLSFLGFSAVVTALSTFFLSEDLRLLLAAPVERDRLFYARFARTAAQASWMVVTFVVPVLLAVGFARCAPALYYLMIPATVVPFVLVPVGLGAMVTLVLVNVFPARRARDVLTLMGLLFAMGVVILLRVLRPERLLSVEALPDIAGFFATLQTPAAPLLPSFWAGEALFSALQHQVDWLHVGALWTTALAATVAARMAYDRHYFDGFSKAQEARKARFTRLEIVERLTRFLPVSPAARHLFVKDLKVFLRDTTQWSQLLLLVALVLVYLYNFRVLDLDRIPWMAGFIKNVYAFVNLAMAAFVLSAVAVRFVFPSVSAEGAAFWIVRTAPVSMRALLWSKFWTGLVPVLVLAETITIVSNEFLNVAPFLKIMAAVAIAFLSFALVGLAAGMGAIHPRFQAENLTQAAGSYGGIAFMVLAVLLILVEIVLLSFPSSMYLRASLRNRPLTPDRIAAIAAFFTVAAGLCVFVFVTAMRRGVRALEALAD
jgi:ABC-2 type transport system permease protein